MFIILQILFSLSISMMSVSLKLLRAIASSIFWTLYLFMGLALQRSSV